MIPRTQVKRLTPDLYDSDMSSDEESTVATPIIIPPVDPDDEVFHEFCDIDICNEADSKLVDWSFNVFIPACRTLLLHCADGKDTDLTSSQDTDLTSSQETDLTSSQILTDLRSLSNTINYFCSEQQRLSGQLKLTTRGISSSLSTDRFYKLKDKGKGTHSRHGCSNTASMSSDSTSSSGFESSQDSQYDRSYAVKILRSVSQSLIRPLLQDSESGFTSDLYKSIVQAIQKIAWKVEACLSFNDPTQEFNIYSSIFDEEQKLKLSKMLIRALPPEEPKLQTVGRSSRSGSVSVMATKKKSKEENFLDANNSSRVIKRTPSGRARPGGVVFDSTDPLPTDILDEGSDRKPSMTEFDMSMSTEESFELGSTSRRRIATFASPERNSRNWSSLDEEAVNGDRDSSTTRDSMRYFRPTHVRRTTISLSRKEVCKLGLNVASRVGEAAAEVPGPGKVSDPGAGNWEGGASGDNGGGNGDGGDQNMDVMEQMKQVKNKLQLLTQKFSIDASLRNRSASTSDLLDNPPAAAVGGSPGRKLSQEQLRKLSVQDECPPLSNQSSFDSPTLKDHLQKSYVTRQISTPNVSSVDIDKDWTLLPKSSALMDSSRLRAETKNSKILLDKKASKVSSRAKRAVEKSLSASGKFTNRMLKTAQALRRGSVSSSKSKRKDFSNSVVTAVSMDQLMEEELAGPRSETSLSEPPSPLPKAETMPKRSKGMGTISRIGRPRSSKSSSTSNSLSRSAKRKSSKCGGFLAASQPYSEAGSAALTESIYRLSNTAVQPSPAFLGKGGGVVGGI